MKTQRIATNNLEARFLAGVIFLLAAMLVWVYRHPLAGAAQAWSVNPLYQHGYIVPLLAAVLLFLRRETFAPNDQAELSASDWQGIVLLAVGFGLWVAGGFLSQWLVLAASVPLALGAIRLSGRLHPVWWGVALLAAGLLLRFAGEYYFVDAVAMVSFIPALAGIFAIVGGSTALRWSWPAIGFLVFMFPLPHRVETALQDPLRDIGTTASVYAIQTAGIHAVPLGNVIDLGEHQVGVAEACSGLAMLMVFLAITTFFALVSQRPIWERLVILASAVPIALIANITRITVTAVFFSLGYAELADRLFHDVAGWLMPLLAVGLLMAEAAFLSRLVVTEEDEPLLMGLEEEPGPRGSGNPADTGRRTRAEPAIAAASGAPGAR